MAGAGRSQDGGDPLVDAVTGCWLSGPITLRQTARTPGGRAGPPPQPGVATAQVWQHARRPGRRPDRSRRPASRPGRHHETCGAVQSHDGRQLTTDSRNADSCAPPGSSVSSIRITLIQPPVPASQPPFPRTAQPAPASWRSESPGQARRSRIAGGVRRCRLRVTRPVSPGWRKHLVAQRLLSACRLG